MAWIVEDVGAGVIVYFGEEALEGDAVVQVFAGMDFVAAIDAVFFKDVKNGPPTGGELLKAGVHEAGRTLWPRIHHRPKQCAGERYVRLQAEIAACLGGQLHLFDGPLRAFCGFAVQFRRRETVEQAIVGWMHRHELPFQMC